MEQMGGQCKAELKREAVHGWSQEGWRTRWTQYLTYWVWSSGDNQINIIKNKGTSAWRTGLKTILRIQLNAFSLVMESEAAYGWFAPGTFSETTVAFSRTCCFHLKEWKSIRTEESWQCSYIAKDRWKDVYRPERCYAWIAFSCRNTAWGSCPPPAMGRTLWIYDNAPSKWGSPLP